MNADPYQAFETQTFEWLKLAIRTRMPGVMLRQLSVNESYSFLEDELYVQLTAAVLGKKLPGGVHHASAYVTFTAPATTWQMFKQTHDRSWWLGWLVRKYPVKTATFAKMAEAEFAYEHNVLFPMQTKHVPEFPESLGRPVYVPVVTSNFSPFREVNTHE